MHNVCAPENSLICQTRPRARSHTETQGIGDVVCVCVCVLSEWRIGCAKLEFNCFREFGTNVEYSSISNAFTMIAVTMGWIFLERNLFAICITMLAFHNANQLQLFDLSIRPFLYVSTHPPFTLDNSKPFNEAVSNITHKYKRTY